MSPSLTPIVFSALPMLSILAGGLVVYKWKKDLHPLLSLSGGILLGVAFLDLLPEAVEHSLEHALPVTLPFMVTLAAIVLFHIFDKAFSFHAHHQHADTHAHPEEHCHNDTHQHTRAYVRAGSIIVHSLLDGIAVGASFAADERLGFLVLLAVALHAFADGMSTVTFLKLGLGNEHKHMLPVLGLAAFAPFIGASIGFRLGLEPQIIALLLALFAGFFIFLSLSELLPQAHSGRMSKTSGVALTLLGILLVILVSAIGHGHG
jgi:ZIP family zinc transporter